MRTWTILLSVFAVTALPAQARAGVFSDDLTRCVVQSATDADSDAFMAWMFSAISADPRLASFTKLDRVRRDKIGAEAGVVMERLLVVSCRKEAVAALKAGEGNSIESAFGAFGMAATTRLFQSPETKRELEALGANISRDKLKALAKEAGISEAETKAQPAK